MKMAQVDIRDPKIELMPKDELKELQAEKLARQVKYVYNLSTFYKKKLDEAGIKPEDINTQEDIEKVPLTTAEEIHKEAERTGDPYAGLICVPRAQIVAECAPVEMPSGAQQLPEHPVFVARTLADIDCMNKLIARCWTMLGIKPKWCVMAGAVTDAATVYSIHPQYVWPLPGVAGELNLTMLQVESFQEPIIIVGMVLHTKERIHAYLSLRPQAIIDNSVTLKYHISQSKEFAPFFEKIGTKLVALAEWNKITSSAERKEYIPDTGLEPYCILDIQENAFYASDCQERGGLHVFEDYFLVEAVDDKGKRVASGEAGKLAVTNLYANAMPLIRYQTNLDVMLEEDRCACGRSHVRILTPEYK
jgi:phenylacetate-CoA ligase